MRRPGTIFVFMSIFDIERDFEVCSADISRNESHGKIKKVVVIAGRSVELPPQKIHPFPQVPRTQIHHFKNERMKKKEKKIKNKFFDNILSIRWFRN